MKRLAFGVFLVVAVFLASPLSVYARGGHGGGGGGGFHSGGVHAGGGGFHSGAHAGGGGWHGGHSFGHHGGGHVFFGSSFAFGWPWWDPWYYPYGYYAPYPYYGYYGPPVVAQQAPAYIQPGQEQPYYWYFCPDSQTYYPYVKTCPGGWSKVVPPSQTPAQSPEEGKIQ